MDYRLQFKNVLLSQPNCILGKNGISQKFIEHVIKLLKRDKIIKIKVLRSFATKINIKELANKLSNLTHSSLLDIRGKTIILTIYNIENLN